MLEVWPSHGQDRGLLRPTPEKMPALRWQSRIGDYRARDSIQGSGLVRDGLRRGKKKCRRRRQGGEARHGNKKRGEREGKVGERKSNEGEDMQRMRRGEV